MSKTSLLKSFIYTAALTAGITLGASSASAAEAQSCTTGPGGTCWFDAVCEDRCYQFACTSDICDNISSTRDCSICVQN